ncbi:hypothetical protein K6Q96_09065 [Grimontia kaedaensis]|uniref:Uncharacterized protein n=1 Tax=Grimontia kaedaensis TaxID=2872157 RepID=A0ABY4WNG0_9GAMM|nr:hypothetical protein [Grimontia kaedaensis]USH01091.1 hypothetical protein K6Q96_09065 [Grimontia kaedaensis]
MTEYVFIVPADYGCLAILDPEKYVGFVTEDWAIEGLKKHFINQNKNGSLISWGCSYGNWIIKLTIGPSKDAGYRSFVSGFKTNSKILLTTYESLTMAAQFEDVTLPEAHEIEKVIEVQPGSYKVTVTQLFHTDQAESDEVFNQKTPHYLVSLEPVKEQVAPVMAVPWFEGY